METSVGMSQGQEYTSPRDPEVLYTFEHNLTYYWVRIDGIQIAMAKFKSIDGNRPGYDFTFEQAIKLIESFYVSGESSVHSPETVINCSADRKKWVELSARHRGEKILAAPES